MSLCDRYSTFVRVGAGFSYTDYLWIRDKPWKEYDPNNPPAFLQVAKSKSSEDKPELYLEPEEYVLRLIYCRSLVHCLLIINLCLALDSSFIIKIKAAEITATGQIFSPAYHPLLAYRTVRRY